MSVAVQLESTEEHRIPRIKDQFKNLGPERSTETNETVVASRNEGDGAQVCYTTSCVSVANVSIYRRTTVAHKRDAAGVLCIASVLEREQCRLIVGRGVVCLLLPATPPR